MVLFIQLIDKRVWDGVLLSKRGSGQQTNFAAKSVIGANGEEIDLSDYPLRYGGMDSSLVGRNREVIEQFEDARWRNKIEFARYVDENGKVIEDNRGGKGSVKSSLYAARTGAVMSHNHPRSEREKGCLGGTFSSADLDGFARYNQHTYRATAAEGTYSISKTKSFNKNSFTAYVSKEYGKSDRAYSSKMKSLGDQYRSGNITYSDYVKSAHKAFNAHVIEMHNSLLAGQKQYGYTYTLERRTK